MEPLSAPFTDVDPSDARIVNEAFDETATIDSCYYDGSFYARVGSPTYVSGGWLVEDLQNPNRWGPDRIGVPAHHHDMIAWYRGGPFTPEQQTCIDSGNCSSPPPLNPSCEIRFSQTMSIKCLNFPPGQRKVAYETHMLGQSFTLYEHTIYRDDAPPETRVWP